jgi:hypothetical protein
MFIVRLENALWHASRVTLKERSSGYVMQRFVVPEKLVEFLMYRPRTTYLLVGEPGPKPLPKEYELTGNDILTGEVWFDPDQGKVVTN